jgi:broad specificity phosphatase PhoE
VIQNRSIRAIIETVNPRSILVAILLLLGAASGAQAQATTVILVRHAEKMAPTGDPDLSEAGKIRAVALAKALERYPLAGALVTQFKRTQQTAAPVIEAQHLQQVIISAGSDVPAHARAVAAAVRQYASGSAILVVGHSNTLGSIIGALGGPQLPDLCDGEYSTMLILELATGSAPRLLRVTYGPPDAPDASHC